jgi:Amt family ammonium transporter
VDATLANALDGATNIAVNIPATIWMLLATFLVFIMVPSIGLLEAGLTRRKNVVHALMKSLSAVGIMSVVFVLFGFSLAFNPTTFGGFLGSPSDFGFGAGLDTAWPVAFDAKGNALTGVPTTVFLLFQCMFAAVTLALVGAGVPERMKFGAWCVYSILVSVLIWPMIAHWVWSPNGFLATLGTTTGWLPGLGVKDFAGGTVVHIQAGVAGLGITIAIGASVKRRHTMTLRMQSESAGGPMRPTSLPTGLDGAKEAAERYGYSLPLAVVGTGLLWLGWFGFNPGSSLDITRQSAMAAIATNTAAALAGMVALAIARWVDGKWDPIAAISGILGGLVMITPNAGYVDPIGATVLGLLAGVVTMVAIKVMDTYLYHIDDPVGGFPVHGVNGIVGTAIVPLFANPAVSGISQAGFFYGGGSNAITWFLLQCFGVVTVTAVSYVSGWGFVKVAETFMPVRASIAEEIAGLDLADHGVEAEGEQIAA